MSNFTEKLRDFGLKKYGGPTAFAKAMGMSYNNLQNYIKEEEPSLPGVPFLIKLRELGCDMNWLLGDDEEMPQKKLLDEIEECKKEIEELKSQIKKDNKIVDAVREQFKTYGKKK